MNEVTVTGAVFEPLEAGTGRWVLQLHAEGTGFVSRAVGLVAAVGDVVVESIVRWPDASGFTGQLASVPADGSRLRVGFEDGPLIETDVVFSTGVA